MKEDAAPVFARSGIALGLGVVALFAAITLLSPPPPPLPPQPSQVVVLSPEERKALVDAIVAKLREGQVP